MCRSTEALDPNAGTCIYFQLRPNVVDDVWKLAARAGNETRTQDNPRIEVFSDGIM